MKITTMTENDLAMMLTKHKQLNPDLEVRPDVIDSLDLWVRQGIEPGGFLLAVLSNDLFDAMARADSYNRATIFQIVSYIANELPFRCHGSHEAVAAWKGTES